MARPLSRIEDYLGGTRFGRLTFVREVAPLARERDGGRVRLAEFRCDCGEVRTLPVGNVKRLLTRSCGCLNRDETRKRHQLRKAGTTAT